MQDPAILTGRNDITEKSEAAALSVLMRGVRHAFRIPGVGEVAPELPYDPVRWVAELVEGLQHPQAAFVTGPLRNPLAPPVPPDVRSPDDGATAGPPPAREVAANLAAALRYGANSSAALFDFVLAAVKNGLSETAALEDPDQATSLGAHLSVSAAVAAVGACDESGRNFDGGLALVVGDTSGMQEFIHAVASRRAARSLRARSFFLQVLSVVAARFVASRLGVPICNVVTANGGNVQILAPPNCHGELPAIRLALENAIHSTIGSRLGVAVAAQEARLAQDDGFGALVQRASLVLSDEKVRRYRQSAKSLGVLNPTQTPPLAGACRTCGRHVGEPSDGDADRTCMFCASLEELGHALRTARYLTMKTETAPVPTGWSATFGLLGYSVALWDVAPSPPFDGSIYALDRDALKELPCAHLLPVGKSVPRDDGGLPLDFENLARANRGRPALAVAKMDVDDLGILLSEHLGEPHRETPARFATFSSALALFFEARVNEMASEGDRRVYMVFSGGDDVLCAGPFDEVLRFVSDVRSEFNRWTADHDHLHLSCGVAVGGASSPIMTLVSAAEEALNASKEFRDGNRTKNAVTIFDRTLPWDEFNEALRLSDVLVDAIADPNVAAPRSLLNHLAQMHRVDSPDGRPTYGPIVWRAYYHLRRLWERNPKLEQSLLQDLYRRCFEPRGARQVVLAARIADIATAVTDPNHGGRS